MALTVEDGSIVSGADTYVTLAEYQAYGAGIGWTLRDTDAEDEIDLRRAFQGINRNWEYAGEPVDLDTQVGAWPRYIVRNRWEYVVPSSTVPQKVKDAQCELAYLIKGGLDVFATITGTVSMERVKAGPVESEEEYLGGLSRPRLVAVDALLRPYLLAGYGQRAVVRS